MKDAIKSVTPKKSDFETQSGVLAFSNYEFLAPYQLQNNFQSSIVGTAFEYVAKIISSLETNTKITREIFENLVIGIFLNNKEYKPVLDLYIKTVEKVDAIISGETSIPLHDEELLHGLCVISKLENLWRSGYLGKTTSDDLLKPTEEVVYKELASLIEVYKQTFFDGRLIRTDSLITYKPEFSSKVRSALMGIDADICVDSILLDFKTTKKNGYIAQDAMQITGYYLFYLIDRLLGDKKSNIQNHKIEKIALYKARFGQVEYYDVSKIKKDDLVATLLTINDFYNFGIKIKDIKNIEI